MLNGAITALWWMAVSGIFAVLVGLFLVLYLGKTYLKIAVVGGIIAVAFFGFLGFYNAAFKHGGDEKARLYNGAIDRVGTQNRASEKALETMVDGRTEQLGVKVKRIREGGRDERDWIKHQEKPDGRIDPQTIKVLER